MRENADKHADFLPNLQIKCGFFVNIFCVATNFLCLNTYGSLIYGLDDNDPDWLL